jgi:hypothetical protein
MATLAQGGEMSQPLKRHRLLLRLFLWELKSIPEYSTSFPTGQTIGKLWKCNQDPISEPSHWVVAMYIPDDHPGYVGIVWFDVELRAGPEPGGYSPPDWGNTKHFRYSMRKSA